MKEKQQYEFPLVEIIEIDATNSIAESGLRSGVGLWEEVE